MCLGLVIAMSYRYAGWLLPSVPNYVPQDLEDGNFFWTSLHRHLLWHVDLVGAQIDFQAVSVFFFITFKPKLS